MKTKTIDTRLTARKKADLDRDQQQSLTLAAFNAVSSVVIVLDRRGRCVRCNPACENLIGEPQERLQGRYFWDLLGQSPSAANIEKQFEILVEQQADIVHETALITAAGQTCWFSWSA